MKTMDQKEFARENVFGLGAENTAYAKYFIGQSYLNPPFPGECHLCAGVPEQLAYPPRKKRRRADADLHRR